MSFPLHLMRPLLLVLCALSIQSALNAQDVLRTSSSAGRAYSTINTQAVANHLDSLLTRMDQVEDSISILATVQAYQQISLSSASLQITGGSLMDSLHVMFTSRLDGNVGVGGDLHIDGTATGITAPMVGLGNVDNTSDVNKPISTATQTALDLKAPLASPTFTGTVSGISAAMVGLGSADNTADADKPVSTATQEALNLKAPLASPTFTGTVSGISAAMVGLGSADNTADTDKPVSTATQAALDLKAPLASPTFTGTVSGISSAMIGLGNVDNTADADKPVSTATQSALDLKAPLASPAFTGTVSGISAAMVGLGNADNTADADKPVSTATQSALDLKAPLASPAFTGTPSLPTGTTAVTQSPNDGSTKVATTDYVDNAMLSAGSATTEIIQEVTVGSDGDTAFTLDQSPDASSVVRMYRNGVLLSTGAASITGTSVTYVAANNGNADLVSGDRIQFFYAY